VATPGKHTLVETMHHAQAAVEGNGAPAATAAPAPVLASTGPQPALAGSADGAVPTGASVKVTVNTPHKAGAAISFDAKDYKELYKQVKARADSGKEAGSVSRGWSADYKTADDKVTEAKYDLPLTMSLPTWTNKASQPQAEQTKFDTWAASVRAHEDRHEQIYRLEYAKMKTAVVGPTEADCDKQSAVIDANAEAEQTKFDAANQPAGLAIPSRRG
jgi:hypothetical protein